MVEKKSTDIFNETLVLNLLFEDIAQGRVRNFTSPSVQTNRQMQENRYQSARQKKNQENINSCLNKKNYEIGFWNKAHNYGSALLAGSADESDKFKEGFKNDVPQPASYCGFGYDSNSSGE